MIADLFFELLQFIVGVALEPVEKRYGKTVAYLASIAIIFLALAAVVLALFLIFRPDTY